MFLKAAKVVAVAAGMMDKPVEEVDLEEQPTAEEVVSQPVDSRVPATVGLVEGSVFDPQVDFELLTGLFGVHKGVVKTRMFSCPNCDHEHSEVIVENAEDDFDMEAEACCEGEDCGYEGEVSNFYDGLSEEVVTSLHPTTETCNLVLHGPDWQGMVLPWNGGVARANLNEYFSQLNGHVSQELPLDWGCHQTLHSLPQVEEASSEFEDEAEEECI